MMGIFLFATASKPALGPTQPPIQWEPGALTSGGKRSRRELNTQLHPVLSLRICGALSPLSQYVFMTWYLMKQEYVSIVCLIKHRDKCIFAL
jgi:hypothetical protein